MSQRSEFASSAVKVVTVVIDGRTYQAELKEFSTGSVGWNLNAKVTIDGRQCQVGLNATVIGSKEWE